MRCSDRGESVDVSAGGTWSRLGGAGRAGIWNPACSGACLTAHTLSPAKHNPHGVGLYLSFPPQCTRS